MMSLLLDAEQLRRRYIILNDQGEALEGFFMEFSALPSEGQVGVCRYVDARGTEDEIQFKLNATKTALVSWHVRSPTHTFAIKPIIDNGELVGLEVRFDAENIAYFALELESYDLSEDMIPSECLDIATLSCVAF
jgi:hypothetical protein